MLQPLLPPLQADVALLDVGNEEKLGGVAERVRALGRRALTLKADVGGRQGAACLLHCAPPLPLPASAQPGLPACTPRPLAAGLELGCHSLTPQVRDRPAVERAVQEAVQQLGQVDVLVANAGGLGLRLAACGLLRAGLHGAGVGAAAPAAASRVVPAGLPKRTCTCAPAHCSGVLGKLCHADKIGRSTWHEVMETNVNGV